MKLSSSLLTLIAATALNSCQPNNSNSVTAGQVNSDIEQAITNLGNKDPEIRNSGMYVLEDIGLPTIKYLKNSAKHTNPLISQNAQKILLRIQHKGSKYVDGKCGPCGKG